MSDHPICHVFIYIFTEDIDATLAKAEEHGAYILTPKTEDPFGWTAIFAEMSLDGFVAGPNEDFQHLFAWMTSGDTDYTIRIGEREQTLKIAAESIEMFEQVITTTGAIVAGRRLYELTHGWGGHHPVGAPVVVVTHRPAPEWVEPDWPVTFTDSIGSALDKAQAIASNKKVAIASTTIFHQCLQAGLVDEIQIDLVPYLLGQGVRLIDHLDAPMQLERTRVVASTGVTHLTFRVVK